MSPRSARIAALNDAFRATIHIPQFGEPAVPGQVLVTAGIKALPPTAQIEMLAAVRNFDAFDDGNDPDGERDFGSFTRPGVGKVFWKIEYFDRELRNHSPDPADPTVTCRVLAIMLAEDL